MKNIQKTSTNKYMITKIKYHHLINYGTYNTLNEAITQAINLEENDWIKNKQTGYNKKEEFPKYNIEEINNEYYIYNCKKTSKRYGPYFNYKYTRIIRKILPYHEKNPDIKQAEFQAQKEFYKYIHYEKEYKTYKVIINMKTVARHKNLVNALQERDIYLLADDYDEETMCNIIPPNYDEPLPPTPWKTITEYIYNKTINDKTIYIIQKQSKNRKVRIKPVYNKQLALHLQKKLKEKNWNEEYVKKTQQKLKKPNRNIKKLNNTYYIYHKNRKYYSSKNLYKVRFIRDHLEENNWDEKEIKKYLKKYNKT